jgi:hypothetical protein
MAEVSVGGPYKKAMPHQQSRQLAVRLQLMTHLFGQQYSVISEPEELPAQ